MSKRRRGWRQAALRARRALRRRRAAARPSYFAARLVLKIGSDADYDVHVACDGQLTSDGRKPPHSPAKKMDEGYNYDPITFDGYLAGVRRRLRDVGRTFDFDHRFALDRLSDELLALEGAIAGRLG